MSDNGSYVNYTHLHNHVTPLYPRLARLIARRRAPFSRAAYAQIGGKSPIREESQAQVAAVTQAMEKLGVPARPPLPGGDGNAHA